MSAALRDNPLDRMAEMRLLLPPEETPRDFALMRLAFVWAMRNLHTRLSEHRHRTSEKAVAEEAMGRASEALGATWPRGCTAFRDALVLAIGQARKKHEVRWGSDVDVHDEYRPSAYGRRARLGAVIAPLLKRVFEACEYRAADAYETRATSVSAERYSGVRAGTQRGRWHSPRPAMHVVGTGLWWYSRVYKPGLAIVRTRKGRARLVLDARRYGSDWNVDYVEQSDTAQDRNLRLVKGTARMIDGVFTLLPKPRKVKDGLQAP